MATAAKKVDENVTEKPPGNDEIPPDTTEKPPKEPPTPDAAKELENANEGKRKAFWTDAIAGLTRRVKVLEEREIAGTVWTIPAIVAMSAVVVALIVSFSAIYFVFKGRPRE